MRGHRGWTRRSEDGQTHMAASSRLKEGFDAMQATRLGNQYQAWSLSPRCLYPPGSKLKEVIR